MAAIFQKITKGILATVILGIAIIFTSIAFPNFERAHWYRQMVVTIVTPPNKLLTGISERVKNIFSHYIALSNAAKENDRLKTALSESKRKLLEMEELWRENERLRRLLQMAHELKKEAIGARVIADSPLAEFKTVTLSAGYANGIRKNMVVIAPSGLVGKIGSVANKTSQVLLITDPNSTVDVISSRSRARALLSGSRDELNLRPFIHLTRLEYLHRISDINEGDVIVTSGLDRLYPAGIPVGTVKNVKPDANGILLLADVVPFVEFFGLQNVAVLK